MKNKKIQEWHLAPELLQKISAGTGDLELALADYIKKTDLIDRTQLNDNCYTGIIQQLQSIRDNYRNKNIQITKTDLDQELNNLLAQLDAMQEATGYTKEQIDSIIESYFVEDGPVDTHINNKIPDIVDTVIAETDINNKISTIAEKVNTTNEELTILKQTVESNNQLANDLYRAKNDKIAQEDLDTDLIKALNDINADIKELQENVQDGNNQDFNVAGLQNQIVLINSSGDLSAADVVEQIEVVTTTDELNAARAQLKTPILSVAAPQAIHSINLSAWNANKTNVPEEVNIPKPPEPEPVYYHVTYKYVSSDEEFPLTAAITATLPTDTNNYETDNEVIPVELSVTTITEADGIWTFTGWDKQEVTIEDANVEFIGTWDFEQNIIIETYKVQYEYYNADSESLLPIPDTVLDTLPPTETDKPSGYHATPPNPYQSFVFDGNQLWQFTEWDEESIDIEEEDVTFHGKWEPDVVEDGNTEYEIYRHTYKVSYQYNGTLPQEVLDTLPAETKGHTNGTEIEPEELETTSVQIDNKVWTFVGWDENSKEVNNADVVFVGTWAETVLPYYAVHYIYADEQPNLSEATIYFETPSDPQPDDLWYKTEEKTLYVWQLDENDVGSWQKQTTALPNNVNKTLPADELNKLSGANIFPANPSVQEIVTEDGKWTFAGWDNTSKVVSNSDVLFIGTWEFEEKEPEIPEEPYVHSSYADYDLAAGSYIKSENITVNISALMPNGSSIISGTNHSSTDIATVCIGFYGTRVKLYTSLIEAEQTISLTVDNTDYSIILPSSNVFVDEQNHVVDQGHFCFFCLEKLSEGLHRICFTIEPGKSLKIDSKISVDDGNHAGILLANDIPNKAFYNANLYDTGNYFNVLTGSYSFAPSNNVHVVGTDDYQNVAFETAKSGYERRLLYAPMTEKLFYMTDTGILILLSQSYDAKLAALEARIAALEG